MMTLAKLARGGLLFLSGFGFIAGARLSITHLQHGEICPMIGPVPACIIVFMGYFMVFVAALMIDKNWSRRVFYMGWTPVFLLALMGRNVSSRSLWQGCVGSYFGGRVARVPPKLWS